MTTALREYIAQSDMTQARLADAMGISQPSVWKWVNRQVPATRVLDVSELTGLSPNELRPDVFGQ